MLLWQNILWLNIYSNTRTTPTYIFKTIHIYYATSSNSCLHNIHGNSPFHVTIVNTNPITHDAFNIYIRALITLFSRLYLLYTIKAQLINYSSHTSIFEQHLDISLKQSTYTIPLCQWVFATVLQTHGYSPFFSVIGGTNSTRHNQIISFIVWHIENHFRRPGIEPGTNRVLLTPQSAALPTELPPVKTSPLL